MQVSDLLLKAGLVSQPVEQPGDGAAAAALRRARLQALLPGSGIRVAPPESEDKLEISPLAHAIVRGGEALDAERWERVEALRAAYLRNQLETDAESLAAVLLPGLHAAGPPEDQPASGAGIRSRNPQSGR